MNITNIMESVKVKNDYLHEWENLINELSEKELALIEWKEIYEIKAQSIEDETDFKAIYGRNNADIRKLHIKQELKEWSNTITDLEISIAWIFIVGFCNNSTRSSNLYCSPRPKNVCSNSTPAEQNLPSHSCWCPRH